MFKVIDLGTGSSLLDELTGQEKLFETGEEASDAAKAKSELTGVEGEYNIRDRHNDEITGSILSRDGKWNVSVFGNSASLVSKDKAVGFVRGVYAAKSGSNSSQVSSELRDEVTELAESAGILLSDIEEFKQRLGA